MTNQTWKDRYKALKKGMGWTNRDISKIYGVTLSNVEIKTSKEETFPKWAKLAVVIYETMLEKGRIVYVDKK